MPETLKVLDPHELGDMFILNDPQAPKFKGFYAGLGWLDPNGDESQSRHYLVVGGERGDGRFVVLEERSGNIEDILKAATDAKDRFCIGGMYCDASDPSVMRTIWDHDGLTQYQSYGVDPMNRTIWANPTSHWPYFRDRQTLTLVAGVPESVRGSLISNVNRIVAMIENQDLLIHPDCSSVRWVLAQPRPGDVANHPAFCALAYLVWGYLHETRKLTRAMPDVVKAQNPYPNLIKARQ